MLIIFISCFYPPIFMRVLEYCIKKCWLEMPRCALILKMHIQLCRINFLSEKEKNINVHKLRWKHTYRINSTLRIKNVMWLCMMGWKTWLTHGPISLHSSWNVVLVILTCPSEVELGRFLYICLSLLKQWQRLCFVCSLWGTSNLSYMKLIILSGFSHFFIFIVIL